MTNPGLYYTRGTVLATAQDIQASLLNSTLDVTGGITLDGTKVYIRLKGTPPYTVNLPIIASVGQIILTFWVRDSNGVYTLECGGSDRIFNLPGNLGSNISMTKAGHTITLLADPSINIWYIVATNDTNAIA